MVSKDFEVLSRVFPDVKILNENATIARFSTSGKGHSHSDFHQKAAQVRLTGKATDSLANRPLIMFPDCDRNGDPNPGVIVVTTTVDCTGATPVSTASSSSSAASNAERRAKRRRDRERKRRRRQRRSNRTLLRKMNGPKPKPRARKGLEKVFASADTPLRLGRGASTSAVAVQKKMPAQSYCKASRPRRAASSSSTLPVKHRYIFGWAGLQPDL